MSETVFILGAGASRDAGAPLMSDFLDLAERLRKSEKLAAPEDIDIVVGAVEELQQVFTKATLDLRNIKGIYGAIEMARLIRKFPGLSDAQIDDLSRAIRSMIVQT